MTQEVIQYLKREPRFRERSAKWRGIADLIIKKYSLEIDRVKLADILAEGSSADRAWRDTLKYQPELRGKDYNKKDVLEERKMLELGYEPNYQGNLLKLKTL